MGNHMEIQGQHTIFFHHQNPDFIQDFSNMSKHPKYQWLGAKMPVAKSKGFAWTLLGVNSIQVSGLITLSFNERVEGEG